MKIPTLSPEYQAPASKAMPGTIKPLSRMSTLFAAATGLALMVGGAQAQTITRYDVTNAKPSGEGGWSYTYTGLSASAPGSSLISMFGGSGTLNDGVFGTAANAAMQFQISDNTTITLHLDNYYNISSLTVFGGNFAIANNYNGALTGATISFGKSIESLMSTPAGKTCQSFPCDDVFTFTGTSLANEAANTIILSDFSSAFQSGSQHYFSITEITATGIAAAVPEPSSYALMAAGLVAVALRARRRKLQA